MRSHRLFSKTLLALAVSQAALSGLAMAEDTALDELKIEGRAITELDQAVSSEDIENSQASSLEDLFRNKSEVSAGGAINSGQKIYVRNLGEDSLNITIDGAEQPIALFHHAGRISIEPELLKSVEVEAGAANATSGPGALGGSVRFVTKDASDLLDDDQNIGALLKSTYNSNGDGLKNSATVYGRTESGKVEGMIHLTSGSHDNYEDGGGNELAGSEQDEQLGFAKVKVQLTDEQSLTLSYENMEQTGDILYRPEWIESSSNYLRDTETQRKTTTLNYRFIDKDSDLIDTKVTLYQTQNQLYQNSDGNYTDANIKTFGLNVSNTSIINNHEIVYGINYRDDESYMHDLYSGSHSYYDESGKVSGVYIQDDIELNSTTLSFGARYDYYELKDVNDTEFSAGGLSPNIGAIYHLSDTLDLHANYAQALRGPEIKDVYAIWNYTNLSSLDVETSHNIEVGATYRKNQLEAGIGVYQSIIDDPIGLVATRTYDNLEDSIETTGLYLDITYRFEKLIAGLHFHTAESLAGDDFVSRYEYGSTAANIGDTLVLSLDYEMSDTFQAGWSAEFVKGMYDLESYIDLYDTNIEYDKPGYAVHNIYAKWLPLGDDQLTVSLAINNLFDKEYLSHAAVDDWTDTWSNISGQNAAGRDIRLSAAYKF